MISQDNANAFCLVAAQVIPTLLIAHFVMERTLPPAPPPRRLAVLAAAAKNLKKLRKRLASSREDFATRLARLAGLDEGDLSPQGLIAYGQERTEIDEKSAELDERAAQIDRLDQRQTALESEPGRPVIDAWYRWTLVLIMFDGLIGESCALLGSLRLQIFGPQTLPLLTSVAAVAILLMLAFMAQIAWLRFRPESLNPGGPFLVAVLVTIALAGVLIAVSSSSPTAKPTPSHTPQPHSPIHRTPRQPGRPSR